MSNTPHGRQRNVTGTGSVGGRRGSGLGTGPVGRPAGSQGSSQSSSQGSGSGSGSGNGGRRSTGPNRASGGGGMNPLMIIIVVVVLLLGGGGGLGGLFGGGGTDTGTDNSHLLVTTAPYTVTATRRPAATATVKPAATAAPVSVGQQDSSLGFSIWDLIGGGYSSASTQAAQSYTTSSAYSASSSGGDSLQVDRTVAAGARKKYTTLKGNGKDTVTLMIYMCGTDLESKSGMATRDIQEMCKATFGDNVRIILYTGGCSRWQNNAVSSSANQIWRVRNGKLECLSSNEGTAAMTNPDTLSGFIRYCADNYPASRYGLILWDHGGGSISGYGYDEKYRSSGSMTLPSLKKALNNGGVKFDFIGFDACLMATVETALVCSDYADYLIASEETEPGVGWYYTNWLTSLGKNTSMDTLDLGKQICDDFVNACATQARGQKTTLSVTDLAELSATVPGALKGFSQSVTGMVKGGSYQQVSNARYGAREFASQTRIDQVDLADLATRVGGAEASELARVLKGAVKYNRSGSLTGAYGLSIYFPYQKPSNVSKAVNTAASIGMDSSYGECIRAFAALENSGQAALGGQTSPYTSLSGGSYASGSADSIFGLLDLFLRSNPETARDVSAENASAYIAGNTLSGEDLVFRAVSGKPVLKLTAQQWSLVYDVDLNLFYDDGAGYMDLGLDNVFDEDGQGGLIGDTSGAWIALNGQIAAYYRESTSGDQSWGYIPVLLDGDRAELVTNYTPDTGFEVVGVRRVYKDGETETIAKVDAISPDATVELVCDYYTYAGEYRDSYRFGSPISCRNGLTITELAITDRAKLRCTYRLTDLYQQVWWTTPYSLN